MKACVFCKTRYQTGSGITFHKFPTNSTKHVWLKNMKIDNWSPKANDLLCSKHFTDDCFIKHAARTTLKSGSVPTCFSESTSSAQCDIVVTPTPSVSGTTGEVRREQSSINDDQNNPNLDEPSITGSQKKSWIVPIVYENIEHDHTPSRTTFEICESIKYDHRYAISSRTSEKDLQRVKKALKISQTRVKVLSQHVKRLKISVSYLKTVNAYLKKQINC
ncbi:THAP domain-containing protein 1-like [Maniola jurtina]|uniref:THAP domain-containing protein 1-like n=1 Tax=Maniola jurtina TaxID=191418 RepID=UPI001E68BC9C|nr:THAP domain-containing protein 1-like [Maniola jurtina]XP_045769723.1 THAP domain-containing protein 1-like [Maniola jurtina]